MSFREFITRYNCVFAMISTSLELVVVPRGIQPVKVFFTNFFFMLLKVQADISHTMSALFPSSASKEKFANYYLYDPAVAADMRKGNPLAVNLDDRVRT